MRKLNRAASSREIPRAIAAPIVDPERLIPGTMAKACAQPISRPVFRETPCLRGFMRSEADSIIAVAHNDQPTRLG